MRRKIRFKWMVWPTLFFTALLAGCSTDHRPDITVDDAQIRARILKTYDRAQDGEAEAQNSIGKAYAVGDGLKKNKSKARHWFELAAKQGHPLAQYNLYLLLTQNSEADEKDAEEAAKWLHAAADRELMRAQFRLAEMYHKGEAGERKDISRAAKLYEAAAMQGYSPAQYNIGRLYEEGRGVEKSETTAFSWFLQAARQGVIEAQIEVGTKYERGVGVAENDVAGFHWFERAALRNSPVAQYNLSVMYALGKGVQKDLVRSYAWSELAANQGIPAAVKNREAFSKLLTSKQLADAKLLARRWAEQISPGASHGHRENSYFEDGSTDPISGLEALDGVSPVTTDG